MELPAAVLNERISWTEGSRKKGVILAKLGLAVARSPSFSGRRGLSSRSPVVLIRGFLIDWFKVLLREKPKL